MRWVWSPFFGASGRETGRADRSPRQLASRGVLHQWLDRQRCRSSGSGAAARRTPATRKRRPGRSQLGRRRGARAASPRSGLGSRMVRRGLRFEFAGGLPKNFLQIDPLRLCSLRRFTETSDVGDRFWGHLSWRPPSARAMNKCASALTPHRSRVSPLRCVLRAAAQHRSQVAPLSVDPGGKDRSDPSHRPDGERGKQSRS
jgi:hypothetical protein